MSEITEGAEPEEIVDEIVEEAGDVVESTDEIGLTSDEVEESGDDDEKKSLLQSVQSMTIFESMLLVSLLCIMLATLFLFLELRTFGSSPWSTDGF